MNPEIAEADLDAAFEGGYEEAPEAEPSAPEVAAPSGPVAQDVTEDAQTGGAAAPDDELAGLPPKVRAMLAEFESIKQAAALVPTLEHKLRSAEGRVAALQKAMPAPTPPAPPRLEKVERVRSELPEVADAIEEAIEHRLKSMQTAAPSAPAELDADDPALTLDKVAPDWRVTVSGPKFGEWLDSQGAEYKGRIERTSNPAEMLDAVTKFKAHLERAGEEAARIARTRQSRAEAAAVPSGAGRRSPTPPSTLDDEFEAGFRS